MPLEADIDREMNRMAAKEGNAREIAEDTVFDYVTAVQDAKLYHYRRFVRGIFVIRSRTAKSAAKMFYRFLDTLPMNEGDKEPGFNCISYCSKGEYRTIVILRTSHRSHHYFSQGPDHLTMSPGCADMGGVLIASVRDDYDKLTPELLEEMLSEITYSKDMEEELLAKLSRKQPTLSVGIMSGKEIEFEIFSDGAGVRKAVLREGKIDYGGILYDELYFGGQTLSTQFAEPSFKLYGVTIGVDFHWERKEDQVFAGALKIIVDRGRLYAVNIVGVEDYLLSVISSEMSADASEEFLKAHAVISRSWVMAQIAASGVRRHAQVPEGVNDVPSLISFLDSIRVVEDKAQDDLNVEYVKWYDHEDHRNFDVCADDHCQRYQGLTRATGQTVRKAIDSTWGQVLTYDGELCDARFSKCCGGRMEKFSTCWGDVDMPYLQPLADTPDHGDGECFCDTQDKEILSQVLNNYDQETVDFYRWTVEYDRDELSELVCRRSGINVGRILEIVPLERGESGRIYKLMIVGSEMTLTVGKELEIRRILSETHLKSSAFDVEYEKDRIVLHGRGWGHGVGLCQIGAAVMASKGYTYKEILEHYYPGTEL
jgi:SpoIID/LytB domain protein